MKSITPKYSKVGLICLANVYFIWGSTYLATKMAIDCDDGFSPFMLGAMRTILAGSILFVFCWAKKYTLFSSKKDALTIVASGLLLWVGGNGLVCWAVQTADSGYAALMVGTLPLWVAIIEAIMDKRLPSALLAGSLLIGFAGLTVLNWPLLKGGASADLFAFIALIIAPLSWATGSVVIARRPTRLKPITAAAYQQIVGAVGFIILSYTLKEKVGHPNPQAWLSFSYLVIAGGLVAFVSFIYALKLLPTTVATTYAYVNPLIAVFLGWLILNEEINGWTFSGGALILLGVAGVFKTKHRAIS